MDLQTGHGGYACGVSDEFDEALSTRYIAERGEFRRFMKAVAEILLSTSRERRGSCERSATVLSRLPVQALRLPVAGAWALALIWGAVLPMACPDFSGGKVTGTGGGSAGRFG